jgi:hypothetical protein
MLRPDPGPFSGLVNFCSIPFAETWRDPGTGEFKNLRLGVESMLKDIASSPTRGTMAMLEIAFNVTQLTQERAAKEYALQLQEKLLQDIKILDRPEKLETRINQVFQDLGAYLESRSYLYLYV